LQAKRTNLQVENRHGLIVNTEVFEANGQPKADPSADEPTCLGGTAYPKDPADRIIAAMERADPGSALGPSSTT
jgi:hypothetical protein